MSLSLQIGPPAVYFVGDGSSLTCQISLQDMKEFAGGALPDSITGVTASWNSGPTSPSLSAAVDPGGRSFTLTFGATLTNNAQYSVTLELLREMPA